MKIGILTFHCAHNYGAVLQAYGLQEYLRSQGHETYIIDYRPGYLTRNYKAFNIRFWMASTPREIVYKLRYEPFLWKHRILRGKAFDRFIRNRFDLHPYVRHTNFSDFDAIFFRERSNLEQNDYRAALRRGILWRKRNMQGYRLCGQHGTRNAFRQRPRTPPAIFGPYDRNRRKGGIAKGVVAAAERQTGLHNDRPHASGRHRNVRKDRLAPRPQIGNTSSYTT